MQSKMTDLTHARLLEAVSYDPETGLFTSKIFRSNTCRVGDKLGSWSKGYLVFCIDGERYKAHRLAWFYVVGVWPLGDIDHINGNPSDNRISNLREATKSQNAANQKVRSDNKCGFRGVYYRPRSRRYVAELRLLGRRKYIGTFDTPEEAYHAYVEAASQEFGPYAYERSRA